MAKGRVWLLGSALTALVVAVALVTWLLVRPDPYVAPAPSGSTPSADPAGATRALHALEDAVAAGDRAGAAGLAPDSDQQAGVLLSAVVDNAGQLRVEDFSMRYVDAVGAVDPTGRWQAAVDVTWRFAGFDREPVHEEVLVGFDGDDGGSVAITSFGGGDRRTPLWLTGPVEVRRSDRSLVLAGTAAEADLLAGRADAAVPVVRDVLPQWQGEARGGGARNRRTDSTPRWPPSPAPTPTSPRSPPRWTAPSPRTRRCTSSSTRRSTTASTRSGARW